MHCNYLQIWKEYVLTTQYFQRLGFQPDLQLIVPRKRIQFKKIVDGVEVPTPGCSFDCLYYCWKMKLPRDVVFLRQLQSKKARNDALEARILALENA